MDGGRDGLAHFEHSPEVGLGELGECVVMIFSSSPPLGKMGPPNLRIGGLAYGSS